MTASQRQRASLEHTAHRPYPLPRGPWVMGQTWLDLLFAHWRLPKATLRSVVPEPNIRTYTTIDGRPGIWFFRLTYRLPYRHAAMSIARTGTRIAYRDSAGFAATYGPAGPVAYPERGTLEYFLTERYWLYTLDGGKVRRAEIHHPPWPLQPARAEPAQNTLTEPLGIRLPDQPPLLHFAARQDVVVWPPHPLI